jgi:sortase A
MTGPSPATAGVRSGPSSVAAPDQRRRASRAWILALLSVVVVVATVVAPHVDEVAGAQPVTPTVELDAQVAGTGDDVGFGLHGFASGPVSVAFCGGGAARGSSDCDLAGSVVVAVGADGSAEGRVRVVDPPVPCPCVVRAVAAQGGAAATAGLVVTGTATAEEAVPAPALGSNSASLSVRSAAVVAAEDPGAVVTSVLGGPTRRNLELVLVNDGPVAVTDPPVSIFLGRDATGGEIIEPIAVGTLEPGQSRTYEVPVELPVLGVGRYVVAGHIDGLSVPVVFAADTTTIPWLAMGLVAFGVIWVAIRAWRGRVHLRLGSARREGRPPVGLPAVRALAVTAVLGGLAAFAYVVWALDGTNQQTAEAQEQLLSQIEEQSTRPTLPGAPEQGLGVDPDPGEPLGVLRIPKFDGYEFAFVEGVTAEDLTRGPGHFPGTALPGEIGNFVLSGHRTTYQAPFNRLDELAAGDRLLIDTVAGSTTYEVIGTEVVHPSRVDVLEPVSGQPGAVATEATITLITCHPEHSAAERLVVHGRLVDDP